jgi:hypothetical protein
MLISSTRETINLIEIIHKGLPNILFSISECTDVIIIGSVGSKDNKLERGKERERERIERGKQETGNTAPFR